jgi:hypothetical protein
MRNFGALACVVKCFTHVVIVNNKKAVLLRGWKVIINPIDQLNPLTFSRKSIGPEYIKGPDALVAQTFT